MVYSVWRPDRQVYNYYEDTKGVSDDGPTPTGKSLSKLGNAPSEISWQVPSNAKSVGSGAKPRGVVVHPQTLGDFELGDGLSMLGIVVAALILYKML